MDVTIEIENACKSIKAQLNGCYVHSYSVYGQKHLVFSEPFQAFKIIFQLFQIKDFCMS